MSRFSHAGDTAPRVRIHTLDGSYVQLAHVEADEVIDLLDVLNGTEDAKVFDGENWRPVTLTDRVFSFDLDDGRSQVHVPRHAIARVDVDWTIGPLGRLAGRLARWRDWLW